MNGLMEREQRAVAYVLRDADAFATLLDVFKAEYVEHPYYQVIYRIARGLYKKLKRPPTAEELTSFVIGRLPPGEPVETMAGVQAGIESLFEIDVTEATYVEVAEYIALRELNALADEVSTGESGVTELLARARSVTDRLEPLVASGDSTKLIYPLAPEYLQQLLLVDDDEEVIPTQYSSLDALLRNRGMGRGELFVFMAPTNAGKAEPLWARVLTPSGWRPIGDLRTGDLIVGSDGRPYNVTGVFPQGKKPIYRVTMQDKGVTHCCEEHLWAVRTKYDKHEGKPFRILSLGQMLRAGIKDSGGHNQWQIPVAQAVECFGRASDLPVDPYVMGALLGNAGLTGKGLHFSSGERHIIDRMQARLPAGLSLKKGAGGPFDYTISNDYGLQGPGANPLITILRGMGLMGQHSSRKFIPEQYKIAPYDVRLGVLQGLMDTDGHAMRFPGAGIEYVTASAQLMEDVCFLVGSLGGIYRRGKSKWVKGKEYPRAIFTFSEGVAPFTLPRKVAHYSHGQKMTRTVKSVEPAGEHEAVCISVSAPDRLYVTDDFIVTHNSMALLNFAANFVEAGYRGAYFTLDDTQTEVDRRFLGRVSGVGLDRPYTKQERHEAIEEWMEERGIPWDRFVLTSLVAEKITVATIRGYLSIMERKGPVDFVVIDYGDLLEPSYQSDKHHLRLGNVFEGLRRMAKIHNCLCLTATQTNRDGLEQEILSLKKIAEGYIKAWPAALFLALCQTPSEMAMEPPRCRLAVLKNKRGRVGVELPFIADWGNALLREDPEGSQRNIAKVLAAQSEQERLAQEERRQRQRGGNKSSQSIDGRGKPAVEWNRPQRKYQAYPADGDAAPGEAD